MSIKSKADWLRGFLESLEYSDNISQKQIKVLKDKLEELLEEIDDWDEYEEDVDDEDNTPYTGSSSRPIIFDDDDDLPF
jgi:hypothetical protein